MQNIQICTYTVYTNVMQFKTANTCSALLKYLHNLIKTIFTAGFSDSFIITLRRK